MPFENDPGKRYDMPASFGPSLLPEVTVMKEMRNIAVNFLTDRAALARILPPFFTPDPEPVLTVSSSHNIGVDWLAGRTYKVVRVVTNVTYRGVEESVSGPFSIVIWESDSKPVIAGRELQGYQKIVGQIPDHVRAEDCCSFECYEYDTRLLRADVVKLEPLSPVSIEAMRTAAARTSSVPLGWKYIPNPEGGADVNYVTKLPMSGDLKEAWAGTCAIQFDDPTWEQAPGSAHIVAALKSLPILEYRAGMVTHTENVTLRRNQVRRVR